MAKMFNDKVKIHFFVIICVFPNINNGGNVQYRNSFWNFITIRVFPSLGLLMAKMFNDEVMIHLGRFLNNILITSHSSCNYTRVFFIWSINILLIAQMFNDEIMIHFLAIILLFSIMNGRNVQ